MSVFKPVMFLCLRVLLYIRWTKQNCSYHGKTRSATSKPVEKEKKRKERKEIGVIKLKIGKF